MLLFCHTLFYLYNLHGFKTGIEDIFNHVLLKPLKPSTIGYHITVLLSIRNAFTHHPCPTTAVSSSFYRSLGALPRKLLWGGRTLLLRFSSLKLIWILQDRASDRWPFVFKRYFFLHQRATVFLNSSIGICLLPLPAILHFYQQSSSVFKLVCSSILKSPPPSRISPWVHSQA